ncbi:Pkinase domain-containing protein [Cephalotus follicularis]|uniref:Pkinase domain-containing protein n=1 Tax=Cephalotus follicularis TaxID=3775 RepID=A0A1Q3C9M0_CEPFO|nr:Pkinase domain-containing protein [Cephalotus follicularis]
MMDFGVQNQTRLIGDYILGPKIGSGSFAVVWRSRHRQLGIEVAVKEIDKKLLSPKFSDSLIKEISILSTINHPNVIRLFEAIETKERIFLVLEYCDGGDLAGYIHHHGKVSESVARHFMRQLAAGLQVLQEKHLIHRDLKPQNLLLATNETASLLKIGDFGFARSLSPQDLADTLCGSPLYMAPEIIQNQKYDAKADLWSVGAILFQLVTGRPPFDGNNQMQLFQNILASTELQFPQGALEELHPDCVDLCRSLLRQNPVQRLTFKEFFNHKFLGEPRPVVNAEQSSLLPQMKSKVEQFNSFPSNKSDKSPQWHSGHPMNSSRRNLESSSSAHSNMLAHGKELGSASNTKRVQLVIPNTEFDTVKVADSMESIEKEYVLVNANFDSMENFSYYLEPSLQDSICPSKKNAWDLAIAVQTKEWDATSTGGAGSPQIHVSVPLPISPASTILTEVQGLSILHPSTRLRLFHQYVQAFAELAQEKYNAGLFLESFSVDLVILAIWKKAVQICGSWMAYTLGNVHGSSSTTGSTVVQSGTGPLILEDNIDFSNPSSVCIWAEQGFIAAYDHAEKLSYHLIDMNAATEMPDVMEIIYQKGLDLGKIGAVDEYINKGSADVSYSKAMLMLSFIVGEATSLPLNPPLSLNPDNKKQIENYIINLESRRSHFLMSQPSPKQSSYSLMK